MSKEHRMLMLTPVSSLEWLCPSLNSDYSRGNNLVMDYYRSSFSVSIKFCLLLLLYGLQLKSSK